MTYSALLAGVLGQQGATGITYIGKGTFTDGGVTTTLSLNINPGHSNGDLLVAIIAINGDLTLTGPGDWTELQQVGGTTGVDGRAGVWYKFADGTEGATEDWTASSAGMAGLCLAYRNVASVANTSANDGRAIPSNNTYTGTLPTVAAGDWVVYYTATGSSGIRTFTEPTDTTELHDQGGAGYLAFGVAHEGPVSSAPAAKPYTPDGTGNFVNGPILLKAA